MPSATLELSTLDEAVVQRLLGVTQAAVPGARGEIRGGGSLVLESTSPGREPAEPSRYRFVVQFGSSNAAGVVANNLWTALNGQAVTLWIGETAVPIQNAAIKDALLAGAVTEV